MSNSTRTLPRARRVISRRVSPPIPTRAFDWLAHIEGDEEGPTGYGPTEAEALRDLSEQLLAIEDAGVKA